MYIYYFLYGIPSSNDTEIMWILENNEGHMSDAASVRTAEYKRVAE